MQVMTLLNSNARQTNSPSPTLLWSTQKPGATSVAQPNTSAWQWLDIAALESASWGAFQIMGFHWQRLGYSSVQDFVTAMSTNETQQFEAFTRFIETDPALHKALKNRKWAEFAKLYNGPDYQRNLYDTKLQRAYERHADCGCGQAVTS